MSARLSAHLRYDSGVARLIRIASIAGLGLLVLLMVPAAVGQIHGVPTSVTSIGFGGQWNQTPGVPASVTSLGPNGYHSGPGYQRGVYLPQPSCCMAPLFPINSNPPGVGHGGHRHHNTGSYYGPSPYYGYGYGYSPAYIPYTPYDVEPEQDQVRDEEYPSGPTIFDRRGSGLTSREIEERYAARDEHRPQAEESLPAPASEPEPVADQVTTVLVFKDGHQLEIQNYAVLGETLYDLTPGHRRKVELTELNVQATVQQNDDRGIDFRLPPGTHVN